MKKKNPFRYYLHGRPCIPIRVMSVSRSDSQLVSRLVGVAWSTIQIPQQFGNLMRWMLCESTSALSVRGWLVTFYFLAAAPEGPKTCDLTQGIISDVMSSSAPPNKASNQASHTLDQAPLAKNHTFHTPNQASRTQIRGLTPQIT